jgi:hypothetical protein
MQIRYKKRPVSRERVKSNLYLPMEVIMSIYTTKDSRIPIRRKDGRVTGFCHNGIFSKKVKGSKHMLKFPLGWACDEYVLEQLKRLNIRRIIICDTETNMHYRVLLNDFLEKSITLNRGYGDQRLLELNYWESKQF